MEIQKSAKNQISPFSNITENDLNENPTTQTLNQEEENKRLSLLKDSINVLDYELFSHLLENNKYTNKSINIALLCALEATKSQERTEIISALLAYGANPNLENPKCNKTVLMISASNGDLDVVNLLIMNKANPQILDKYGQNALFHTLISKKGDNADVVSHLILHGCEINISNTKEETPLLIAVKENLKMSAKVLIDNNANVNVICKLTGNTLVHYATESGNLELVKLLVFKNVNLKALNNEGQLALNIALNKGRNNIYSFLYEEFNKKTVLDKRNVEDLYKEKDLLKNSKKKISIKDKEKEKEVKEIKETKEVKIIYDKKVKPVISGSCNAIQVSSIKDGAKKPKFNKLNLNKEEERKDSCCSCLPKNKILTLQNFELEFRGEEKQTKEYSSDDLKLLDLYFDYFQQEIIKLKKIEELLYLNKQNNFLLQTESFSINSAINDYSLSVDTISTIDATKQDIKSKKHGIEKLFELEIKDNNENFDSYDKINFNLSAKDYLVKKLSFTDKKTEKVDNIKLYEYNISPLDDDTIFKSLSIEILEFYKYNQHILNLKTKKHVDEVVEKIKLITKNLLPNYEIQIYGSFATNLALDSSDVDLVLSSIYGNPEPMALQNLYYALKLEPWIKSSKNIDNTSVPILKFITHDSFGDLKIDISLKDTKHQGMNCIKLVKSYLKEFSLLCYLVIAFKQILKLSKLNDPFSGGMSSYALILMIVYFLQNSYQTNKSQSYDFNNRNINNIPYDYINDSCNLGRIFCDILYYYGFFFNENKVFVLCRCNEEFADKVFFLIRPTIII